MSDLVKSFTETIETDRHTWKVCTLCDIVIEEKVFSKVLKLFEEVNLLKFPTPAYPELDGFHVYDEKQKKYIPPTKKQFEQATRKYKVGDEYQWFGYSEGEKHLCRKRG